MTRRRFYARPQAFSWDDKLVELDADETRHLRDVLRLRAGNEAFVFNGEGQEYRCRIARVDKRSASLEVLEETAPSSPESPLHLTLAVALLKGEKFDLVIQKATELGVARLIPIITSRADVKIKSADDAGRKLNRWERIALEATKQCGRARLMRIEMPGALSDLIAATSGGIRLMFAERDGEALAESSHDSVDRTEATAVVGPEGGWTDDDINQARLAGFEIVTLGGRVMRAETAAIVVAALLQHRLGDVR
jgi:16S rRNA (uracil1498-N3)-methyltransferase